MGASTRRLAVIAALVAPAALLGACIPTLGDPTVSLPYTEDFSGECLWPEDGEPGFVAECEEGAYEILVRSEDAPGGSAVTLAEATPSLAIEARADVARDPSENGFIYGVSCVHDSDAARGYEFVLDGRGNWAIMRANGEDEPLELLREGRLPNASPGPRRLRGLCAAAGNDATILGLEIDGEPAAAAIDERGYRTFDSIALTVWLSADHERGALVRFDDVLAGVPAADEIEEAQADAAILFEDTFWNPASGWATGAGDVSQLAYERGRYRVVAKGPDPAWSLIPIEPATDALVVEAEAEHARGPAEIAYGVVCYAERDDEDGYIFAVSPSGGYAIFRETHDDIHVITDGTGDFNGVGRALHVRAECVGGEEETELGSSSTTKRSRRPRTATECAASGSSASTWTAREAEARSSSTTSASSAPTEGRGRRGSSSRGHIPEEHVPGALA